MPRKGENIYARKDGRWEGRFIKGRDAKGRYCYGYVYARTYREAKEKLIQKKSRLNNNEIEKQTISHLAVRKLVFGTLIEEWIHKLRPQIKESSYIKYRNMARNYLVPELGDFLWVELRREDIELFCNEMLLNGGQKGKGLSQKTVSDLLSMIRNVFRYANICGYPLPCDISSITVKQRANEFRILSRLEQETLCRYLYSNMNERNLGIMLSLFTGLRVGEVCALKWEDISFAEQTIYVHKTMQRIQSESSSGPRTKITISSPKSQCSIRRIPIPGTLVQLLEQFPSDHEGYILTGSDDKYIEPRILQRHFKKILINTPIEPVKYHTLRHTFATRCVEMNFDIKSLSEILGHASVTITMNRYVHPSMELKRENMQKLSNLITVK